MDYGTLAYARKGGVVQRFTLRPGSITVGRTLTNDLVLDSDEVSPNHARLFCTPDGVAVLDLENSSGTFLNLVRLQPNIRHPLRDGDIIRVGPFFLRYTVGGLTATATATSGAIGMASGSTNGSAVLPPEIAARIPASRARGGALGLNSNLVRRLNGNVPMHTLAAQRRLDDGLSSYLEYLPPSFQESEFMGRFLLIFESILAPIERQIDNMHFYFDPRTTPEGLLPWLSSWVGLVADDTWPLGRRRHLIASAAMLYRWQGTRRGMVDALQIFAEVSPIIIEPGDTDGTSLPPHAFAVILEVPDPEQVEQRLIESVIILMKPAHTSYVLEIRQSTRAPSDDAA